MTPLIDLDPRVDGLVVSPTLAARVRANELAQAGRRVYRFGLGQSPFPVPAPVVAALRAAAGEKDYLPPGGLPALQAAVVDYHRRRHGLTFAADDVVIGPGSKELLFLLQLAFAGDVMVPTPSWVSYVPQARLAGRVVVRVPGGGRHGLMVDPDELDRLCRTGPGRPRLLVINSPSNPTGLAYTGDELERLAAVCRAHAVVVVSDEIYGELTVVGEHRSLARAYPEGTIVASGLSKWCGAGGWRLGTMAFPPTLIALRRAMIAIASETYSSTSAPIQHAAVVAFRPNGEVEAYLAEVRRLLAALLLWSGTELMGAGLDVPEAAGGFYLFPSFAELRPQLARLGIHDDVALVDRLLTRTGVMALPGSAFGMAPGDLRLRLALVDFDGARALTAAAREVIGRGFLERYLTPTWEAVTAIVAWCQEVRAEASP
ncbi:MAG: aminotransferase class I/II-fold pyridoxal phosphate-dependent enzyme [Myxococcales bacterium]|nr:aminotransferase class I/II-fold pyridoxal phosphate-dependent enzyme [Myxococcales bacterium]